MSICVSKREICRIAMGFKKNRNLSMVDISQKVLCDGETIRKEVKGRLERIRV